MKAEPSQGGRRRNRPGGTRHILFIADFAYSTCRPILSGVISRLSSRPDVRLLVRSAHPDDTDLEHTMENVDGVISCIGANDRRVQWFSAGRRGPHLALVYGGAPMPSARRRSAKFLCDNKAVGKAAAELLARHDLASFGYIGARVASNLLLWDAERRDAFLAALGERGLSASVFAPATDPANAVADTAALGDWLKSLHYPCGVFVVNDERALEVLGVCHAAGIAVPEQVQIVGVDNEPWICEKTTPTLTSIEPDFEGAGWRAADAVLEMMAGAKINARCATQSGEGIPAAQTFGVRRVMQRMSTTDTHGHAGRAVRARDYIAAHADEHISVAELAKKLCCSVRTLQVSYTKVFGMRVSDEIATAKVAIAKKLLAGDTPIDEIPEKVGYESPHHFKLVFKAKTGMSMREWRHARKPQ